MGIFFGWIILSVVVGAIGNERKIGFAGGFFLSLLFSPLVGLVFTLLSKSKSQIEFEEKMILHAKKQASDLSKINKASFADELFKLKTLLDSGLISNEEFEEEKGKLKNNEAVEKTILALYCSEDSSMSRTLQVRVGKGNYFTQLPKTREKSLRYEVTPGDIEITISSITGLSRRKKTSLHVKEQTTAYYDILDVYNRS